MLYRLTIKDVLGDEPNRVYESHNMLDMYVALRDNDFPSIEVLLALISDYRVCEVHKPNSWTKAVLERFL